MPKGNRYIERAEHAQRLKTMRENLRKTGQAKFNGIILSTRAKGVLASLAY